MSWGRYLGTLWPRELLLVDGRSMWNDIIIFGNVRAAKYYRMSNESSWINCARKLNSQVLLHDLCRFLGFLCFCTVSVSLSNGSTEMGLTQIFSWQVLVLSSIPLRKPTKYHQLSFTNKKVSSRLSERGILGKITSVTRHDLGSKIHKFYPWKTTSTRIGKSNKASKQERLDHWIWILNRILDPIRFLVSKSKFSL